MARKALSAAHKAKISASLRSRGGSGGSSKNAVPSNRQSNRVSAAGTRPMSATASKTSSTKFRMAIAKRSKSGTTGSKNSLPKRPQM